jgi:hypothetical protein
MFLMETFNALDCALAYGFDSEEAYYAHLHQLSIEDQERIVELDLFRPDEAQAHG